MGELLQQLLNPVQLGAEGGGALELRAARGGVGLGRLRPSLERRDRRVALGNLARRLLGRELLAAGGVVALAQLLFGARERRRPLREMLLQLRLEELECHRLLLWLKQLAMKLDDGALAKAKLDEATAAQKAALKAIKKVTKQAESAYAKESHAAAMAHHEPAELR